MLHDRELLDRLAAFAPIKFDGEVFRATRRGLDPLAPSVIGGRWMLPNETPTLYTSCEHDGAMAEIVHHWSQLTPLPSKPVIVHTLGLRLHKTLRLARAELIKLDVNWDNYGTSALGRTPAIGAAVAHLEYDGLIAPSARWTCENIMLFMTNHDARDDDLVVRKSMEINWRQWMNEHALGGRPAEYILSLPKPKGRFTSCVAETTIAAEALFEHPQKHYGTQELAVVVAEHAAWPLGPAIAVWTQG